MKKILAIALAICLCAGLCACSGGNSDDKYVIGTCKLMPHNSLDEASRGFRDALYEILGEENVVIIDQDAGGEFPNMNIIIDGFLAEGVDLILANGTGPLQAAVSSTDQIPILGTSVTDYATALNIPEWNGIVGGNVSGTTDLAPLDEQAAVIAELFPEAELVGLLYCSGEPNSVYQVTRVAAYLKDLGLESREYSFADVNELAAVTQRACDECDVIYIPTDNTCAAYAENIANVVLPAGVPVVSGDDSTCAIAGVATFSIDYYELGYQTGLMAAGILTGEQDISTMAIQAAGDAVKLYNPANCEKLGISVPDDYVSVEQDD